MSVAEQNEAQAYFAALNQEAMERVTFEYVISTMSRLREARQSDPRGPATRSQMHEHRNLLTLTLKHRSVRHSALWMEYMRSQVGQGLEDQRWQLQFGQQDQGKHVSWDDKKTLMLE